MILGTGAVDRKISKIKTHWYSELVKLNVSGSLCAHKLNSLWCFWLFLRCEKTLLLIRTLQDSHHILPSCLFLQQSHHTFTLFFFLLPLIYFILVFLIMSLTILAHFFRVVFLILCHFCQASNTGFPSLFELIICFVLMTLTAVFHFSRSTTNIYI